MTDQPANQRDQHVESEILADYLEKPLQDNRTYKVIKLQNELEALIIHDPDTDKASAALDNAAGSFSDDADLPGMAHAVEHLLFMGTKKLAATSESEEDTTQVNGVQRDDRETSPLYGALDRFAQFFIEPLFLEETLDRELRAVDSENKKNLQSDTWRLIQLSKFLSNPEHPFSHFSTGNLQCLRDDPIARGVNIREEFMKFHNQQYSANRMKLVVLGRESLDTLQLWVEELFKDVVNKKLPPNRWDGLPWATPQQLQKLVFAKPVMDKKSLKITFPFVDEEKLLDKQPGRYLSHLIGHEGPGSILAYTKAKGWVNSLSAGSLNVCAGSPGVFTISISLTDEGMAHYKEITEICFQYISILHETPPQEWIFNEIKDMAEVDFRFKQKGSASRATSGLAQTMQEHIDRNRLLNGESVPRRFDGKVIGESTGWLKADNVHLTVITQDDPPGEIRREKWYGTEFSEQDIPRDLLDSLRQAEKMPAGQRIPQLHLPKKNEFIPERLSVHKKDVKEPAKAPRLIRHEPNVRLWYKKDDQFWVPKANVQIALRNPLCGANQQSFVLTAVIEALIEDALAEYAYDADLAGLAYSFQGGYTGLNVAVSGYNDKMSVLLEKVLATLRDLEIKQDRFNIVKERMTRSFKNVQYAPPYQQVAQYTRFLGTERAFVYDQLLPELERATVENVRSFHALLVSQFHIEMLVQGNVDREEALIMADTVSKVLDPRPLLTPQWPIRRSVELPKNSHYVYQRQLKDEQNVNHCIEYMLQVGHAADRESRARLLVFTQMTEEPAFDQLRTKEQLGYIVFSGLGSNVCTDVFHVLIQSERDCEYLEQRIDSFLAGFKDELHNMTDKKFEEHKRSVINKRLEKLKNLNQECTRFWTHITSEFLHFDAVDDDVAHIRKLKKQDLIEFYDTCIDPRSQSRSKLSLHLLAKSTPEDLAKEIDPSTQKAQLLELATRFFTESGIEVNEVELKSALERVNLQSATVADDIALAMAKYVQLSMGGQGEEQLGVLKEQVKPALAQVLPTLGIVVQKAVEEDADAKEVVKGQKKAEVIKDVHEWKARMGLSSGAAPVRDLSEFEDFGARL
ncbi:MAG: hypothetical protein Q9159_000185 [Coniocarpon cinnabarinum]